jgi:hypothetical protein
MLSTSFLFSILLLILQYSIFYFIALLYCRSRLHTTWWRLGEGGASTAARTGAKLANPHKLSGEPLPRAKPLVVSLVSLSVDELGCISKNLKTILLGIINE